MTTKRCLPSNRRERSGLGVARYIGDRVDAQSAEIAVCVLDEWQAQAWGLGWSRGSARARAEGRTRFTADVLVENAGAKRLLGHVPGAVTFAERDAEQDVVPRGPRRSAVRLTRAHPSGRRPART